MFELIELELEEDLSEKRQGQSAQKRAILLINTDYNEQKGGGLFVATIDFCIFAVCGLSGIYLQFYQGFKVVKSF